MDLGCLDLGCVSVSDKTSNTTTTTTTTKDWGDGNDKVSSSASRPGKNKSPRGSFQSSLNSLNKFTSQIKKPPHRKTSPINWFPRKKVEPYLKRKIKMLQEVAGMNLTLDETLGDSNPHYSRVLKEKIAAREAAHKAMEARKAALVEASWCRILQAARIQCKEAEGRLLTAEKTAAAAFEEATALGVIMYDIPNCPPKACQIETSTRNGGRSTTHTVTASFETPFAVDKKVAAAVKKAFVRLATCSSFNRDEFTDLLRKISENPDTGDTNQGLSDFSSECESESGSELETFSTNEAFGSQDNITKLPIFETRESKLKRIQPADNMENLVDMMFERLGRLKEDELSSLATIVATCGLNAALAETESRKMHEPRSAADSSSRHVVDFPPRLSSAGVGSTRYSNIEHFMCGQRRNKEVEPELPSLDKFLVKHMTKLEREVQEAKISRRNESRERNQEKTDENNESKTDIKNDASPAEMSDEEKKNSVEDLVVDHKTSASDLTTSEATPDLGSVVINNSSKLEEEAPGISRKSGKTFDISGREPGRAPCGLLSVRREQVQEVPSLDKFLRKHETRLEREVREARNRRKVETSTSVSESERAYDGEELEKESLHANKEEHGKVLRRVNQRRENAPEIPSLENFLKKHETRLEIEVREARDRRNLDSSTSVSHPKKSTSASDEEVAEKENVDSNMGGSTETKTDATRSSGESTIHIEKVNESAGETLSAQDLKAGDSLEKISDKPVQLSSGHSRGKHMHQNENGGNTLADREGLDKVLRKHFSRLEKEKMAFSSKEEEGLQIKKNSRNALLQTHYHQEGSLEQILLKPKPSLEREKAAVLAEQHGEGMKPSVSRREARERELQEAWRGLSLGNTIKPHLSRLERDKAAWIKAEEEERRRAMNEV